MDINFFDGLMLLSFFLVLVVIVRVYNAVRLVNARVTLLSSQVRELRHPGSAPKHAAPELPDFESPAPRAAGEAHDLSAAWTELAAQDQHLSKALGRDFTAPKAAAKPRRAPEPLRKPVKVPTRTP